QADDGRLGRVNHRHLLAAIGGVAAGIRGPPGAGGVVGVATVTRSIGDGANDSDGHSATGVVANGRVKVPGAGALDGLVAHAGNDRFGGVLHGDLLTALGEVAAGVGRPPGARGVKSVATVTGEVGHGVDNRDSRTATGVAGCWRVKRPVAGALDGLVAHAGNQRRGVILQRHLLAAIGRVAAGIGRPPGARGVESIPAVTGEV